MTVVERGSRLDEIRGLAVSAGITSMKYPLLLLKKCETKCVREKYLSGNSLSFTVRFEKTTSVVIREALSGVRVVLIMGNNSTYVRGMSRGFCCRTASGIRRSDG